MATYSIIVPSYNQEKFIAETLENLSVLKQEAAKKGIHIQLILVDNCSEKPTRDIIDRYRATLDICLVEKDRGQYDAINKGLRLTTGDYWTWLNTDDLINPEGFFRLADAVSREPKVDYIYGNVAYIDENSGFLKASNSGILTLDQLVNHDASISQPGSFFKTTFTKKIGELAPYHFAFDYEYVVRCFRNHAQVSKIDVTVAHFRYYNTSKSGSRSYRFLQEQLEISKYYGGKFFSKLGIMLRLRIIKRKLLN